jgi:hypothetical protein
VRTQGIHTFAGDSSGPADRLIAMTDLSGEGIERQGRWSDASTPIRQPGWKRSLVRLLSNGKQLAAVFRIKPLRRLRCWALTACGYGESDRWTFARLGFGL